MINAFSECRDHNGIVRSFSTSTLTEWLSDRVIYLYFIEWRSVKLAFDMNATRELCSQIIDPQAGAIYGATLRVGRFFPGSAGIIDDFLFHASDVPSKLCLVLIAIHVSDILSIKIGYGPRDCFVLDGEYSSRVCVPAVVLIHNEYIYYIYIISPGRK